MSGVFKVSSGAVLWLALVSPGATEDQNVPAKYLPSLAHEIEAKGLSCPSAQSAFHERIDAFALSIIVTCSNGLFRVTLRSDALVDVEPVR